MKDINGREVKAGDIVRIVQCCGATDKGHAGEEGVVRFIGNPKNQFVRVVIDGSMSSCTGAKFELVREETKPAASRPFQVGDRVRVKMPCPAPSACGVVKDGHVSHEGCIVAISGGGIFVTRMHPSDETYWKREDLELITPVATAVVPDKPARPLACACPTDHLVKGYGWHVEPCGMAIKLLKVDPVPPCPDGPHLNERVESVLKTEGDLAVSASRAHHYACQVCGRTWR